MQPAMEEYRRQVDEAVAFLRERLPAIPEVVIQLGTGLGALAEAMEVEISLPYEHIPHFPKSTVESHSGKLVAGRLAGKHAAILQGRFHYYEGYSTRQVAFPLRVFSLLGTPVAVITNASGGLNPAYMPGSLMIFADHLNFLGENPLRGPNVDEWGPRFPDFSVTYDPELRRLAREAATLLGLDNVWEGVYVCIPGPSLETPAETRYLRSCGADAVGMSSIPEVIVARHGGMRVLGLSVVANCNNPDAMAPIILEEIVQAAAAAGPKLQRLILEVVANLGTTKTSEAN